MGHCKYRLGLRFLTKEHLSRSLPIRKNRGGAMYLIR